MSDVESVVGQDGLAGLEETSARAQTATAVSADLGAISRWIADHPRRVLWIIVLALIPYVLLCWGATFTVLGALVSSGGCGG